MRLTSRLLPGYDAAADPAVTIGAPVEAYAGAPPLDVRASRFPHDALLAAVPDGPLQILELGCGGGRNLALLAELFADRAVALCGVDVSEPLLRASARRAMPPNVRSLDLVALDLGSHPLPDGPFDLVVSSKVLYATGVRLTARLEAEIARVTRGAFFLEAYTPASWKQHARALVEQTAGRGPQWGTALDLWRLGRAFAGWDWFYRARRSGAWTLHVRDVVTHQWIWRRR